MGDIEKRRVAAVFVVREGLDDNRREINEYIRENWGGPTIVTLGNATDSSGLPGFVAEEDGALVGALLYRVDGNGCEVAAMFARKEGIGVGRALLDAVVGKTREMGWDSLWLVTTNDNIRAIRFYQRYGFTLKAAHIGSFAEVKRIKGLDVEFGMDGIRIEHELEFGYPL